MTTRCFSPPLSVANGRSFELQRAGGGQRSLDDREVGRPFDLERAEVRIAAHHRDFARRCSRTRAASPAARPPCGARAPPRESCASGVAVERRRVRAAAVRVPASIRSSVVLPDAVRSEDADEAVRRHIQRHAPTSTAAGAGARGIDRRNQTSAACSNAHTSHGAAPERREPERLLVAPIEQVLDAAEQLEAPLERPAAARRSRPRSRRRRTGRRRSQASARRRATCPRPPPREPCVSGPWTRHHVERPLMTRPPQQRIAQP